MASPRLCSECGASLLGRKADTKTCSQKCRSERSRRLRGLNTNRRAKELMRPEIRELVEVTRGERGDVVDEVVKEELRPVVREAITEDTLRAVQDLIALTPNAVRAIEDDLTSEDPTIRHRAAQLVIKYTVGHPAIVRPPEEEADKQLVVNFNIPRPEELPVPEAEVVTDEETRECDMCHASKPLAEFVGGSYRCQHCYDEQQERARTMFDG